MKIIPLIGPSHLQQPLSSLFTRAEGNSPVSQRTCHLFTPITYNVTLELLTCCTVSLWRLRWRQQTLSGFFFFSPKLLYWWTACGRKLVVSREKRLFWCWNTVSGTPSDQSNHSPVHLSNNISICCVICTELDNLVLFISKCAWKNVPCPPAPHLWIVKSRGFPAQWLVPEGRCRMRCPL